jgi:hypothetical protein
VKKAGFLRRAIILLVFAFFYSRFVLDDSHFIENAHTRALLRMFLFAAVAWGIITMLAERLRKPSSSDRENDDE